MSVPLALPDVVSMVGPPYQRFDALNPTSPALPADGGWIMVWNLGVDGWETGTDVVVHRPGGVALTIILPDGDDRPPVSRILRAIERSRPQAVLPFHDRPCPREVACVIRRPPASLSANVCEYLDWRGFSIDPVTRSIIRRTVELSPHVQTITALARSLYISRRALGRRLLNGMLPVPSHWLHMARVLRATIKLQNSDASLFSVACSLGYPDGFSLSNQMSRLCGLRPSETRTKLGWEWVFETWLMREAERGAIPSRVVSSRETIAPRTARRSHAPASPGAAVSM